MKLRHFNHHSASVLPVYVDNYGNLNFLLEEKDPGYKEPYFNQGAVFFGGNWEKRKEYEDRSPKETLIREIEEEFRRIEDPLESLNELVGEDFISETKDNYQKQDFSKRDKERVWSVGKLILRNLKHRANYEVTVRPPIMKESDLVYGSSVFISPLSKKGYEHTKSVIEQYDGAITPDNVEWGSRTFFWNPKEDNPAKFAWGYDQILHNLFPHLEMEFNNHCEGLVKVTPLLDQQLSKDLTYKQFETLGIRYHQK